MIIKNIDEAKIKYTQDLKYNSKRFIIFFIVNFSSTFIFGLLFLYIEHCYDIVAVPKSYREANFVKICAERRQLVLNESTRSILSTNISDFHTKLEQICENDTTVDEIIACEFNAKTFTKWGEYTMSIQYTIGWGNIVTRSELGRWVTTFSTIPLITINAVTYIYCGTMTITAIKLLIIFIEKKMFKGNTIVRFNRKLIACQSIFMACAVASYILFTEYFLFKELSITDIVYVTVVTFTTVGFGDIMYDREKFADKFAILVILNQLLFVMSFAMVASWITAITEMISNQSNKDEDKEDDNVQTPVDKKPNTTKDVVISNILTS